ncbi:hypothetical protein [Thermococcus sp. 21S7]|uniref:hypothetical protein n=1 Tax=Thermococcus sp. 21S7 TaxID=1638221 RepID=UPI00143940A9|nr:hypothetical protein [Thermococcus sp. 21S7]NJE60173.1 hypothetical protein [Thermococcus sp. 21S7]
MIALALGAIVGFTMAAAAGRLKGRLNELTIAILVPLLTYIVADGFHGGWTGNVFISTPLGDFTPDEMIGLDTFLALLLSLLYVHIRGRRALSIDEFPSFASFATAMIGLAIGLSAGSWHVLLVPGLAVYALLVWLSLRNPFTFLNAVPCGGEAAGVARELGFECLTDRESLGILKVEKHILIGGKAMEMFPRWKEVAGCIARVPASGGGFRVGVYLLYLLPVPVGLVLGEGLLAAAVLVSLAFVIHVLSTVLMVSSTKKRLPEGCREVTEEYRQFFRKNKKRSRFDAVVD